MNSISRELTNNRYVTDRDEFRYLEEKYEEHGLSIGVDISELYALYCLVECCDRTTKRALIILFEFIKSDCIQSVYLKKLCKNALNIKRNMLYNQFKNKINLLCKLVTTKEEELNSIKLAVSLLHVSYMAYAISNVKTLETMNTALKLSKIPYISNTIASKGGDLEVGKLVKALENIVKERYNKMFIDITDNEVLDFYNTIKSLGRSKAYSYFKKSALMEHTDTVEYGQEAVIQYSLEVAYVIHKINNLEELIGNQRRKLFKLVGEFGIGSIELDSYINEINNSGIKDRLAELRKEYKYITPSIMSDDLVLSCDRLKLAKLNYEIIVKAEGIR